MSQESMSISRTQRKEKLGDRVRKIADQLKQETELQIKATSRILGAAAQIAENHDQLITEVADMVKEDLEQQAQLYPKKTYTVDNLKQKFGTLREAKAHFDIKANTWVELVKKLNNVAAKQQINSEQSKDSTSERLDAIESELKMIRKETSQILLLLEQLFLKKE